jgi:hypothetical protein
MVRVTTISPTDSAFDPEPAAPYPFNTRQYARLLALHGRVQDQVGERRRVGDPPGARPWFRNASPRQYSPCEWSVMDELERLVDAYRLRASASVASNLDVLMNVERIRDPSVVPFLPRVLGDSHETEDVPIYVLKQRRNGGGLLVPADRPRVAKTIGDVLADQSTADLRLQAALALGEFTQIDGVLSLLNAVCLAQVATIDLRYAAFTSLERAGPTPECSRYCARCRATRHSGALHEVSCRPGTSNSSVSHERQHQ